jgi:hypothetical protein
MKTLSVGLRFVVIGVTAIVAVVSCTFPIIPGVSYCVEIGARQHNTATYVEWKSQGQFDAALQKVCDRHHGTYHFNVLIKEHEDVIHEYHACNRNLGGNIRTVKVTKSKAADRTEAGASVANDPNATWRVASSDPDDIKTVLDALKP